jgi:hypothetical protein
LRTLDPDELASVLPKLHRCADLHGRVGVEKIVAALRTDPEQKVEPGVEQGRFSRLVGAVDQMQIRVNQELGRPKSITWSVNLP